MAELLEIPGVTSAQPAEANLVRIGYAAERHPAETVIKTAQANDWGLYQICPEHTSLEDVFVQMTQTESG